MLSSEAFNMGIFDILWEVKMAKSTELHNEAVDSLS